MKQLLLRVPDELHARLTAQAKARGISLNALANDVLGLGIDPTTLSRLDQVRIKLMALGPLKREPNAPSIDEVVRTANAHEWDEAAWLEQHGPPTYADELIAYERGHDRLP
jgi:hypothetical protein